MAKIRLNDGTVIGDGCDPYFVAEVNSSHNGKIDVAREMLDVVHDIGCDCVKFQSWSKDSLYSKTYYDSNPISRRIVDRVSLSLENQKIIAEYSRGIGLPFASTPYSKAEVDFLMEECKVPFIKIASMDINNLEFIKYVARKNTAIVLATGMATEEEIIEAVRCIEAEGNNRICLLHCIAIYPSAPEEMQMRYILRMKELFPNIPIGFSDHTLGPEIACAAIALGACMVEKHFTLDSSKMGMDNNMATEPNEFKLMIDKCRNVYVSLGNGKKYISEAEMKQRQNMRRSVIATRDLEIGHIITEADVDAKRPGNGISVRRIGEVIGKKVIKRIEADTLILSEDIDNEL